MSHTGEGGGVGGPGRAAFEDVVGGPRRAACRVVLFSVFGGPEGAAICDVVGGPGRAAFETVVGGPGRAA